MAVGEAAFGGDAGIGIVSAAARRLRAPSRRQCSGNPVQPGLRMQLQATQGK
jgi:hypothetical protein